MSKYRLPELKGNRCVAPVALLLAIFTFTACSSPSPPPPQKDRIVVIFGDVTSSLLPSESNQVANLTSEVLDNLPPGTRYFVYPIQVEALKVEAMIEGTIVVEKTPEATKAVQKVRRDKLKKETERLYALIKSAKRSGAQGNPDNHTCILYTLNFAQSIFKQFDKNKTDFELIYVSDMIEECDTTPMGKPISLAKANIREAITLAQATDLNLDLSYARVSMIIPATSDTYVTGGRPNVSDLRDFWEAILLRSGFSQELLENDQKFYFKSGLPDRFKRNPELAAIGPRQRFETER